MNRKLFNLYVLFIIILFATGTLHAQSPYKNQLKLSPFRLIDFVNPGLELSYERMYHKKYSTQLSAAWMSDPLQATEFKNYNGERIALEEKYFYMQKKYLRTYFSAELVVLNTNFETVNRFVDTTGGFTISNYHNSYRDTFSVHKRTQSFYLKGGIQFTLKRLTFDFSAGLGLKHKHITQAGRFDPNDPRYSIMKSITNLSGSNDGDRSGPTIPLNAKIGFLF